MGCFSEKKSDAKRLSLAQWERVVQAWGEYGVIFSNSPRIEFLRRKVTFGHVGIVQKAKKPKNLLGYFLHVKARWPLTGPHAERRAAAPSIPVCV